MGFKHSFERALAVSIEDVEFQLSGAGPVIWADFLLNPRRLRGSDFLMRWSQGVWSEERLVHAVNATKKYFALPYGPSGVAPDHDVRAFELYFERLEHAGLGNRTCLSSESSRSRLYCNLLKTWAEFKNCLFYLKAIWV